MLLGSNKRSKKLKSENEEMEKTGGGGGPYREVEESPPQTFRLILDDECPIKFEGWMRYKHCVHADYSVTFYTTVKGNLVLYIEFQSSRFAAWGTKAKNVFRQVCHARRWNEELVRAFDIAGWDIDRHIT